MKPAIKKAISSSAVAANNAEKRAFSQKEDKVRMVRVAKVRRSIVFLAAIILPLCLMVLLAMDYMYRPDAFAIESIQQEGEFKRVNVTEVDAIARETLKGNFFTANLDYVRASVESIPWVRRAAVRREWPSTIVIRVYEHKPLMRWESESWVSYRGEIIKASKQDKATQQFKSMIQLSGDEDRVLEVMAQTNEWLNQFHSNNLQILGVTKTESGAWSLSLNDRQTEHSVKVILGSEQHKQRFKRLLRMYEQNEHLVKASKLIDVRYPNGMAIVPLNKAQAKKAGAS